MQYINLKLLLKTIVLTLLLLIPISLNAEINTHGMAPQDWPTIIQKLEAANQAQPNNPEIIKSLANAYNNYGLEFTRQKAWSQAESYLQKAINLDPSATAIKKNLSGVYFQHAYEMFKQESAVSYNSYNHSESKQLCNLALSTDPQNINASILLGDIEYLNQNMDAAQTAWQQASRLAPENAQVQNRLDKIKREVQVEATMGTKYNMFFIIKVDPAVEKLAGFDISQTLDTIRMQVSSDFNYTQNSKIPVLVYTSQTYKDSIPDAPDWSEGAYDGKIRIVLTQYKNNLALLKSTIVHEYTHAVIADLTNNSCPRWLNEGIAKYEEYKHGIKPRLNMLASAYNTNNLLNWDNINEAMISPNKSEAILAYQQSFNFVQYLVERYGMSKITALLTTLGAGIDINAAFQQVYGIPLATAQKNWSIWLVDFIQQWANTPVEVVQ